MQLKLRLAPTSIALLAIGVAGIAVDKASYAHHHTAASQPVATTLSQEQLQPDQDFGPLQAGIEEDLADGADDAVEATANTADDLGNGIADGVDATVDTTVDTAEDAADATESGVNTAGDAIGDAAEETGSFLNDLF